MPIEHLSWLQQWYQQQCDGDWEHNENIKIIYGRQPRLEGYN